MKKILVILLAALTLSFTGCMVQISPSASSDKSTSSGKPLTFEVTQEMKENNISPQNTAFVKTLADLISAHPYIGAADDFSIMYSGKYGSEGSEKLITFFAINKTNTTFKNISFVLTMKVADNCIIDSKSVTLSKDTFGDIAPYVAKPVTLILDDEHFSYLKNANNSNVKVSMADFKADSQ